MQRLIPALMATTVLAMPGVAAAETYYYGEIFGGGTYLSDTTLDFGGGTEGDLQSDFGYNIGGAAGMGIRVGGGFVRLEGELAYRSNANEQLDVDAGGGLEITVEDLDGDYTALSGMGNIYYELVDLDTPLTYWVGTGIGYAQLDLELTGDLLGAAVDFSDSDGVFAYQFMAGTSYALNEFLTLKLGYNYFATADPTFTGNDGGDLPAEYSSHNVKAYVTYNFY